MAAAATSRASWSVSTGRKGSALAVLLLLSLSSLSFAPGARAGDPYDGDGGGDWLNPTSYCRPYVHDDLPYDEDTSQCFSPAGVGFGPGEDCDGDGDDNLAELLEQRNEPCGPEEVLEDSDGDGWDDKVEDMRNLQNDPLSDANDDQSEPRTDDDGDGCDNLLEWLAGSDRTDPGSPEQGVVCGEDASEPPELQITSVDDKVPQVRPDGTLFVPGHLDRFVSIRGTTEPGRVLEDDQPVSAVLLNYNGRGQEAQCATVPTTPPEERCQEYPNHYNGNSNTRASVPGGRYWKLVNGTGPEAEPYQTWAITLDLQGADIPRTETPDGYVIPIRVIAYSGPLRDGYPPGTEMVADGSCVHSSDGGKTCTGGLRKDTRVPLVPPDLVGDDTDEWSREVQLDLQFVQDHVPVVNLVGLGGQGPSKKTTNVITATYEDSDDNATQAWALVCKATATGACDDKATDPAPLWVGCAAADGAWDTNVALECDWTSATSPTGKYYVRVAAVNERGYNTTAANGAFTYTAVVARIGNLLAVNGNLTDRTVHDELVTLSGRIVDQDSNGNGLRYVQVTVSDRLPGTALPQLIETIPVKAADITPCGPVGGAAAYCWSAAWNASSYAAPYSEGNDLRVSVNGTDSEGFALESDLANSVKDLFLDRNAPPQVEFASIELENGTVYEFDRATGNWTSNGIDVGANPVVYGEFRLNLTVTDANNLRPAWSASRLDDVQISLGKGEAPFVVTSPALRGEDVGFEENGLDEIHVDEKRVCEQLNPVVTQAPGQNACVYSTSSAGACNDALGADPQKDINWAECTLDTRRTPNVDVTKVPGYILTSRGTIVLGADTVLLGAGFAQCVEDRAAAARDVAEDPSAPLPTTCQVNQDSVDESDTDGNVDVQFGSDAMQVLCEYVVTINQRAGAPATVPPQPPPPALAATSCPLTTSTSSLTSVVRGWLLGLTVNEGEVIVGVSTVCSTSSATSSPWCSTAVRNRPGDELEVRDYRLGDNDGAKDGDEYDQVDRAVGQTTTKCHSQGAQNVGPFPATGTPIVPRTEVLPAIAVCPFAGRPGEDTRPFSDTGAPDCADAGECVIPFGQLADDLGINGLQVPVTVDGVSVQGYLVTPDDFTALLGNAVCYWGTSLNREAPNPPHTNCGSPKDQGTDNANYTAGYLDHRKPNEIMGGGGTANVFGNLRDPNSNAAPTWAIPRGFQFEPANNTTGLDTNVTQWTVLVNATAPSKADGLRQLFAVGFDGVEDFGTTGVCGPEACNLTTVRVNNAHDLDRDGYRDQDELDAEPPSDPNDAGSVPPDADEDFVPDNLDDDLDGDGFVDDEETEGYAIRYPTERAGTVVATNNSTADTDGDGYSDGAERDNRTDATDPFVHPDDLDGDGYANDAEALNRRLFGGRADNGTSAGRTPADQDGDGWYDWEELVATTDRFDASKYPRAGNHWHDLDSDRDRVPTEVEKALCGVPGVLCVGDNYVPPMDVDEQVQDPTFQIAYTAAGCTLLLAGGADPDDPGGLSLALLRCVLLATGNRIVALGATPESTHVEGDADGDGFPAHVGVHRKETSVRTSNPPQVFQGASSEETVAQAQDPDDGNPNLPVARVFQQIVIVNAVPGPDADRDGFPAYVTIQEQAFTVDTRPGFPALTPGATSSRNHVVDERDDNKDNPAQRVFQSSAGCRGGLPGAAPGEEPTHTSGPDADGDGLPDFVRLEGCTYTIDSTTGQVSTAPNNALDQTVDVDGNDANPCVPVQCTLPNGNAHVATLEALGTGGGYGSMRSTTTDCGPVTSPCFKFRATLWDGNCQPVTFGSVSYRYRHISGSTATTTIGPFPNAGGDNVHEFAVPASMFSGAGSTNVVVSFQAFYAGESGASLTQAFINSAASQLALDPQAKPLGPLRCRVADSLDNTVATPFLVQISSS